MGERGLEGAERGFEKGKMGEKGKMEEMGENGNSLNPLNPVNTPFDIEKLKFYPLDESLPPIVKLKLRCKELNFILHRLQESLLTKMQQEKTLPTSDKIKISSNQARSGDDEYEKILEKLGLETLDNGEVIKREL